MIAEFEWANVLHRPEGAGFYYEYDWGRGEFPAVLPYGSLVSVVFGIRAYERCQARVRVELRDPTGKAVWSIWKPQAGYQLLYIGSELASEMTPWYILDRVGKWKMHGRMEVIAAGDTSPQISDMTWDAIYIAAEDGNGEPPPEGEFPWLWVGIGAAVAVAVVTAIKLKRK